MPAADARSPLTERTCTMALISLRQLLDHAAEHGYGVPAFNVNNLEQTRAIMEAARETDSPVIMQASAGARKYRSEEHTSELQSRGHLVCRLLLEKKKQSNTI